jgi:hypothetical protein
MTRNTKNGYVGDFLVTGGKTVTGGKIAPADITRNESKSAGSASATARSIASLIPTPLLRHILPALVFATQSPYSGCQNVVNSRNVMCNTG